MSTLLRENVPELRERPPNEKLPAERPVAEEREAKSSPAHTVPRLAIVVPCFNEEEVLPQTVRRLRTLLERLQRAGRVTAESRIVLIDDGSRDGTWELIERMSREDE